MLHVLLLGEAASTNFIVFSLKRERIKLIIFTALEGKAC